MKISHSKSWQSNASRTSLGIILGRITLATSNTSGVPRYVPQTAGSQHTLQYTSMHKRGLVDQQATTIELGMAKPYYPRPRARWAQLGKGVGRRPTDCGST